MKSILSASFSILLNNFFDTLFGKFGPLSQYLETRVLAKSTLFLFWAELEDFIALSHLYELSGKLEFR